MTDKKLLCEVVTPDRILFREEVDMVVAPGVEGELGILPTHTPLITVLNTGELRVKHGPDHLDYIAIDGGYLEVREDKLRVLATAAEFASKVDIDELNKIKESIEGEMSALPKDSEEFAESLLKLERVTNRIRVAEKRR